MLIEECKKDTPKQKLKGVAVVTRKGSFMVGSEIFIKNGYAVIDTANLDFKLFVKEFSSNAWNPKFKITGEIGLDKYITGLTIIRADQCSYAVKNTKEICETAMKDYGI